MLTANQTRPFDYMLLHVNVSVLKVQHSESSWAIALSSVYQGSEDNC